MTRLTLIAVTCAALLVPLLDAAGREAAEFTKVNYFHLTADQSDQTALDPMIRFERKYLLRGAVTLKDQESRYGSYYTLMWKVADRSLPVTVRFEYRQQKTAGKVSVRESEVTEVKRKNLTKFAMTGDDFESNGRVVAWRASLVRGDEVLARTESFLWD